MTQTTGEDALLIKRDHNSNVPTFAHKIGSDMKTTIGHESTWMILCLLLDEENIGPRMPRPRSRATLLLLLLLLMPPPLLLLCR